MASGVYCIKNRASGKVYVGESIDIQRRWESHRYDLSKDRHYNEILQHAWNKWGEDAFEWIVLEECDKANLRYREAHWINELVAYSRERGYNIRIEDGNGSWEYTDEHRAAISARTKGENNPRWGAKLDEDTRRRISESNKRAFEEKPGLREKSEETKRRMSEARRQLWATKSPEERRLTEEHKRKVSEAGRGRKHDEDTKRRISETNKKTKAERPPPPISDEARKRMSDSRKGRPAPNKGVPHSEEAKALISARNKGRVYTPEQCEEMRRKRKETLDRKKAEGWTRKPRSAESNAKWRESMERYHEQKKLEKVLETPVPLQEAGYIASMESGGTDGERID